MEHITKRILFFVSFLALVLCLSNAYAIELTIDGKPVPSPHPTDFEIPSFVYTIFYTPVPENYDPTAPTPTPIPTPTLISNEPAMTPEPIISTPVISEPTVDDSYEDAIIIIDDDTIQPSTTTFEPSKLPNWQDEQLGGSDILDVVSKLSLVKDATHRQNAYAKGVTYTKGELVQFVDKNFEYMLREAMEKPNDDIYQSDLDYISRIKIYADKLEINSNSLFTVPDNSKGLVSSLEDLTNFRYLKDIAVVNQNISDASPLSELRFLIMINLDGNKIKEMPQLADPRNLRVLSLRNNYLQDLNSLSQFLQLSCLRLDNNSIDDIYPLKVMYHLRTLTLSSNNLSNADAINAFKYLRVLDLSNNQLDDILYMEYVPYLKVLDISSNNIDNLSSLKGHSDMRALYVNNNNLTSLDQIVTLRGLKWLSAAGNDLNNIDIISKLKYIQRVCLSGNDNISDFSPVFNNETIKEIWLDDNQRSIITGTGNSKAEIITFNTLED